jgi:hypothetical protein
MKLYGAIDLHSNNNVTVLIDEQDQVVYQKRLPNDLPLITQELSGYRDRLQGIVVESTYNWYWLVDGLMDQGHRVHLANTAAIQQYEGLKYTDDHSDARGSPAFCDWEFCRRAISIRKRSERYAICCANAARWSTKNRQLVKHTESGHPQHRQFDSDQDAR